MRTKTLAGLLLAGVVAASVVAPAGTAGAKQPGVKLVAKDAKGDWGANQDPALAPIGDEAGGDLLFGMISMADKSTVVFSIKVNKLPEPGGTPEAMRYIWSASVDGEYVELDGKFTNYSRGACDPTAGSCPPPRDPGSAPFLVRGNCTTTDPGASPVTTCEELGIVQAEFDVDGAQINIPVPLELIGAKKGSKIAPGTSDFTSQAGGSILAIASTFLSRSDYPSDAMQVTGTYVVPKK